MQFSLESAKENTRVFLCWAQDFYRVIYSWRGRSPEIKCAVVNELAASSLRFRSVGDLYLNNYIVRSLHAW